MVVVPAVGLNMGVAVVCSKVKTALAQCFDVPATGVANQAATRCIARDRAGSGSGGVKFDPVKRIAHDRDFACRICVDRRQWHAGRHILSRDRIRVVHVREAADIVIWNTVGSQGACGGAGPVRGAGGLDRRAAVQGAVAIAALNARGAAGTWQVGGTGRARCGRVRRWCTGGGGRHNTCASARARGRWGGARRGGGRRPSGTGTGGSATTCGQCQ